MKLAAVLDDCPPHLDEDTPEPSAARLFQSAWRMLAMMKFHGHALPNGPAEDVALAERWASRHPDKITDIADAIDAMREAAENTREGRLNRHLVILRAKAEPIPTPLTEIKELRSPARKRLAVVCFRLASKAEDGTFLMPWRVAADVMGKKTGGGRADHTTGGKALRQLEEVGLIELVDAGDSGTRKSHRYRWTGPDLDATDTW